MSSEHIVIRQLLGVLQLRSERFNSHTSSADPIDMTEEAAEWQIAYR
jgi:hypothetical protein